MSSRPSTRFNTNANANNSNTSVDEYELHRREKNKIIEANRKREMGSSGGDGGDGGDGGGSGGVVENNSGSRSSRANVCDVNGEEFKIVCEELWVDFKTWVNHNKNASDCITKVRTTIAKYWRPMWLVIGILIWFRWYIGAGKDACSYSFGYGVFSFVCEVMRYMGELAFVLLLMIMGVCAGLLPIIVCLCMYEFNDTFPDPDGDGDGDGEHVKKE
jgi:hypothetical protein